MAEIENFLWNNESKSTFKKVENNPIEYNGWLYSWSLEYWKPSWYGEYINSDYSGLTIKKIWTWKNGMLNWHWEYTSIYSKSTIKKTWTWENDILNWFWVETSFYEWKISSIYSGDFAKSKKEWYWSETGDSAMGKYIYFGKWSNNEKNGEGATILNYRISALMIGIENWYIAWEFKNWEIYNWLIVTEDWTISKEIVDWVYSIVFLNKTFVNSKSLTAYNNAIKKYSREFKKYGKDPKIK